jgi:hypothetical protein
VPQRNRRFARKGSTRRNDAFIATNTRKRVAPTRPCNGLALRWVSVTSELLTLNKLNHAAVGSLPGTRAEFYGMPDTE